ncbi:MAG: tail fiber protein [Bacteroidota bacterium]
MEDAFIGTIFMWPLSWAPVGYAFCNGQAIAVNQYQALYSLIGNMYGGDTANFNLPDLRGRFPLGAGTDALGIPHPLAQHGGSFQAAITGNNLPLHSHALSSTGSATASGTATVTINGVNSLGDQPLPGGNYISGDNSANATPFTSPATSPTLSPLASATGSVSNINLTISGISGAVQPGGGVAKPVPLAVVQPYLNINFIIALTGIYPPRP